MLALILCLGACDPGPVSIEPLKRYALNYRPCEEPEPVCIGPLDPTPHDVAHVLARHPQDDEYKLYVTLVLVKLCRAQFETMGSATRCATITLRWIPS